MYSGLRTLHTHYAKNTLWMSRTHYVKHTLHHARSTKYATHTFGRIHARQNIHPTEYKPDRAHTRQSTHPAEHTPDRAHTRQSTHPVEHTPGRALNKLLHMIACHTHTHTHARTHARTLTHTHTQHIRTAELIMASGRELEGVVRNGRGGGQKQ